MQIWKSPNVVFIWKQYTENFAFSILRILELFAGELCKFLKKYANFYRIVFFCMFVNKLFPYLTCAYLKTLKVL